LQIIYAGRPHKEAVTTTCITNGSGLENTISVQKIHGTWAIHGGVAVTCRRVYSDVRYERAST